MTQGRKGGQSHLGTLHLGGCPQSTWRCRERLCTSKLDGQQKSTASKNEARDEATGYGSRTLPRVVRATAGASWDAVSSVGDKHGRQFGQGFLSPCQVQPIGMDRQQSIVAPSTTKSPICWLKCQVISQENQTSRSTAKKPATPQIFSCK